MIDLRRDKRCDVCHTLTKKQWTGFGQGIE